MSKKKNRKLKKALYAQLKSRRAAQPQQVAEPADSGKETDSPPEQLAKTPRPRIEETGEEAEEMKQVKGEVKKIILTAFALALAIAAVFFINERTDFILKAGAFLLEELNLGV